MTSKLSAGSPPCAAGSTSGPMTSFQSQKVHGQPCVSTIGSGLGPLLRMWMKWIGTSSMVTL